MRRYEVLQGGMIRLDSVKSEDSSKNPFIDTALLICSKYCGKGARESFRIRILGANQFYSQTDKLGNDQKLGRSFLNSLPSFDKFDRPISKIAKTGLGSSAALTVALVGSLLLHWNAVSFDQHSQFTKDSFRIILNLSQICHCLAQGKIGSGFDVSSAVFGSQIYTRFDPSILTSLMQSSPENIDEQELKKVVNECDWDSKIEPFRLPRRMNLVLADVGAGCHTPSMVSTLMKWKDAHNDKASEIWRTLNEANSAILEILRDVYKFSIDNPVDYDFIINLCAGYSSTQLKYLELANPSDLLIDLSDIHRNFEMIRLCFRELTELVGIPIEPESQTEILDQCLNIPGVLIAGVPGAGGYDAIFCLTLSDKATEDLESYLSKRNVCTLNASVDNSGIKVLSGFDI